jgi:hypothetical protein
MRKLVLWGHDVAEYQAMFALDETVFQAPILEFGCGPSAVNAELSVLGHEVTSVDPLFALPDEALKAHVLALFSARADEVRANPFQFDVCHYGGIEAFIAHRERGLQTFFADFPKGFVQGRYQAGDGLALPFTASQFGVALCSHFLFADLASQTPERHVQLIIELARVAKEVRIFPLIDKIGQVSPLLGPVLLGLQERNFGEEVREVAHALYPAGNAMLRVWAKQCDVS